MLSVLGLLYESTKYCLKEISFLNQSKSLTQNASSIMVGGGASSTNIETVRNSECHIDPFLSQGNTSPFTRNVKESHSLTKCQSGISFDRKKNMSIIESRVKELGFTLLNDDKASPKDQFNRLMNQVEHSLGLFDAN